MIEATPQSLKVIAYLICFTVFASAVMLTGADVAKESALRWGAKVYNNSKPGESLFSSFTLELQKFFVVIGALLTVYSVADMKHVDFIKLAISNNIYYIILIWCSIVLFTYVTGSVVHLIRSKYVRLYMIVFAEKVDSFNKFLISCVRVQVQASIISVPALTLAILPYYKKDLSLTIFLLLFCCAVCYIVMLSILMFVARQRARRRLLFNDVGYFMCSLALVSLLFEENSMIPAFMALLDGQ